MPSTLVHLALGGLVAAALLRRLGWRALLVALAAAALPDLDTFLGLWVRGAHRAAFHTLLLPAVLGAVVAWDAWYRDRSWLRARWGDRGVRVAGVAVATLVLAGVLPDLFTNGVNVLWPVHDEFYAFDGHLRYSTTRGILQTFVEFGSDSHNLVGNTSTVHYTTGVDPNAGSEPEHVERVFYVLGSGRDLLLLVVSGLVVGARLREDNR